ncbi:FAD:protein FMN transferase [Tropicibacter sp. R15_0]|uniref:FAD:protein FMN transferase n=1 Tax=Tropicibacter sp. R15_0 TaxID=2821101 RepID=UPI001ADA5599|nr:FAD:protein FMN transferase [Tropicibacter sp. R15_0]MBO9467944.1 FAD:protein FMN transferase [Tropicibacter sp. R15_0]
MSAFSRRRFLSIAAASMVANPLSAGQTVTRWSGRALGAGASMQLVGVEDARAQAIFAAVEAEVARLERIFSLYHPDSELARLNAASVLDAPSLDLLEVLSLSDRLHHATHGLFDPSIQARWQARALGQDEATAKAAVGWDRVSVSSARISLDKGQALTLNGIAQGFITDKIAALLRGQGLRDVMVDMGELKALGKRADGGPWRLGVITPEGQVVHRVSLSDRALATSAATGTILAGGSHILDPAGRAKARGLVSVATPSAALADGLSTALCLAADPAPIVAQFEEVELVYSS